MMMLMLGQSRKKGLETKCMLVFNFTKRSIYICFLVSAAAGGTGQEQIKLIKTFLRWGIFRMVQNPGCLSGGSYGKVIKQATFFNSCQFKCPRPVCQDRS